MEVMQMQVCPKCGHVTMDNNDKYCPECIYRAEYQNVDNVSAGLKEMYKEDYEMQKEFESYGVTYDNSYVPKTREEQLAEERAERLAREREYEKQHPHPSVALNAVHIQLQQRIGDIVYSLDL